jgi:RNA methyltransferase, TrmH family
MLISSVQNPRIKALVKLNKRHQRDEEQRTLVEGVREVSRALGSGITPTEVYVCSELIEGPEAQQLLGQVQARARIDNIQLFYVTPQVFGKIAYRGDSGGFLLVIPYLEHHLEGLPLSRLPFLAVVEGAEKPGNLGAILRTADAAGVDGLVLCTGGTDLHNPNVVRASLGTLFTIPVAEVPSRQVIDWLKDHLIAIVAATPGATIPYTEIDMTGPVAIAVGSEAHGLSNMWLSAADHQVVIPMHGFADSLNLATSTALLLYEVVRQRSQKRQ